MIKNHLLPCGTRYIYIYWTESKVKHLLMTPQKQLFSGKPEFSSPLFEVCLYIFIFPYKLWNILQPLWLAVVVVHHCERLLVTGLVNVLAHAWPVDLEGLGVGVAAGQELEAHPAEADLGLLEKALAPRRQLVQLGQDQAGLPIGEKRENRRSVLKCPLTSSKFIDSELSNNNFL